MGRAVLWAELHKSKLRCKASHPNPCDDKLQKGITTINITVQYIFRSTIMRMTSPLLVSSYTAMALTVTAIAVAVLLLASNFTIINAQQQQQQQQQQSLTSQSGEIENRRTTTAATTATFQSTNDSFSVQVPQGWVIQALRC